MKLTPDRIRKIAIFRALQLGDMLCAVPAFRALRNAYPEAEITLIGLPWAKSFVSRFDKYLDKFLHFPGYPGLPEQPFDEAAWALFRDQMQAENFDLVLQMQGNGTIVNDMLSELTEGTLAGFRPAGSNADSELLLEYPEGISEIDRHLRLMQHLGVTTGSRELEFPVASREQERLNAFDLPIRPRKYICVHPGSRGAWRQWPVEYFARLADECAEIGYDVLVTGTEDERHITSRVIQKMRYDAIDLTGVTGLGEVGQLIDNALLLISNCTGVSHIAAATKTPSIVISMDGEPERWGPLDTQIHKTIDWTKQPGYDYVSEETSALIENLHAPVG